MQTRVANEDGRARLLADGNRIPFLGLGVWQVPDGPECVDAVRWALELGYRHIDTAQAYGNEESVGQALRESGVPRDEVFVTTKFYPGSRDPVEEAARSLERLGIDYVDLYIVHWPQGGPTWAWPGMERARELGYTRSIGVSNYNVAEIETLLSSANVPPVVNQVQFSPYEYRKALLDACAQHGIALEAYSPLGTGRHLSSEAVGRLSRGAWAERPHRCCFVGASSARSPRFRSRRTASGSPRTFSSSISRSRTKTSRSSTGSTAPAAPNLRSRASGGAGSDARAGRQCSAAPS
jgi:diketogulonate reductase-like aldo/keto reductase